MIVDCLASIDQAAARCSEPVRVVVAADRCRDRTAELASSFVPVHCHVSVVAGRWRTVGAARAAAVAHGVGARSHGWIANTDADCRVPSDWLQRQLDLARSGIHAVAGTVRLDGSAPAQLADRFHQAYGGATTGHRHVHAANFGVRVDAYRLAGGWSPHSALGEEHHLWRRLRRRRLDVVHDESLWVFTSHRVHGRVIGGFATKLRRLLVDEPLEVAPAS
jgi:hypothetical protein